MRIVVTGATGNIGTALVRALAADTRITHVTGLARRHPTWHPEHVTWVEADVTSAELVPVFTGADVVVHLAWAFQPSHDPLETWRVNVGGSERVFQAVVDAGVPALVHASSIGTYASGPKEFGVDESWPTDSLPTAAYGREKAYVERLLDGVEAANPHLRVVRLRPGFIFQEAAAMEQLRIFAGPLFPPGWAKLGHLPFVPRTPGLRLQVLHAADAAEAFHLAATRDVRGAFNVAADPPIGPDELASVFGARVVPVPKWLLRGATAVSWHLRLQPTPPQLVDLALSVPIMDTTRARTELGWTPRYSSLDALRALARGMEEQLGAATPPLAPPPAGREVSPARPVGTGAS
jgi:UDP-glucose 4-epimerase